jgi:MOSC domain-containing protein YiiM
VIVALAELIQMSGKGKRIAIVPTLHLTTPELEAGLDHIRQAPKDNGILQLIVRRPRTAEREVLQEAQVDPEHGLVGDNWKVRDESPDPATQLNIMNARAVALVAQDPERWQLAGDQLFIDIDLSGANLPPGTQLAIGTATIEVSAEPHTGCKKFVQRFGLEAMKFVNSPVGRALNLRGVNARVVQAGVIRVGDVVKIVRGGG